MSALFFMSRIKYIPYKLWKYILSLSKWQFSAGVDIVSYSIVNCSIALDEIRLFV